MKVATKTNEDNQIPKTMVVVVLTADERKLVRKHFENYGAAKRCQTETGIHYTTIARLKQTGKVTEDVKTRLFKYLKGAAA